MDHGVENHCARRIGECAADVACIAALSGRRKRREEKGKDGENTGR
jgi:hypothetical protein